MKRFLLVPVSDIQGLVCDVGRITVAQVTSIEAANAVRRLMQPQWLAVFEVTP